jgi:hypothetical protein
VLWLCSATCSEEGMLVVSVRRFFNSGLRERMRGRLRVSIYDGGMYTYNHLLLTYFLCVFSFVQGRENSYVMWGEPRQTRQRALESLGGWRRPECGSSGRVYSSIPDWNVSRSNFAPCGGKVAAPGTRRECRSIPTPWNPSRSLTQDLPPASKSPSWNVSRL